MIECKLTFEIVRILRKMKSSSSSVPSLSRSFTLFTLLLNFLEDGGKFHVQIFGFSSSNSLNQGNLLKLAKIRSGERFPSWMPLLHSERRDGGTSSDGDDEEGYQRDENLVDESIFQELVAKQKEQEVFVSEAKVKLAVAEKKIIQTTKDKDEEVNRWRKKEEEMRALKEEKETELQRVKFQLSDLKASLVDTEKRANEAKKQYSTLMEKTSIKESTDRQEIDRLQQQFSQEEKMLKSQIQSLNDELSITKTSAEESVQVSKQKEQELKTEVNSIQAILESVKKQVADAKDKILFQKQDFDKKLKDQREESDRQRKAFSSVASYDRRNIQKEAWDALNQLTAVKYQLVLANKEMKQYRDTSEQLGKRVQEMEDTYQQRIYDLEDRMESDQMEFAKAKKSAKDKLVAAMADFKLKLRKQKKESEEILTQTTLEYEQQIKTLNETYALERERLLQEKNEEIAKIKLETAQNLKTQADKYHLFQVKARERLFDEQKRSAKKVEGLKNEMDRKINWVRQTSEIQKQRIIEEKDEVIAKNQDNASRAFIKMESDLTQQIMDESSLRKQREDQIDQQNNQIEELKKERTSFRKLARMTWKLTREKTSNLVRRNKKKN